MKKRVSLFVTVLLAALLLCGCAAQPNNYDEYTPASQQDPLSIPTQAPATQMPYDPLAEEDGDTYVAGMAYDEYGNALYAGATPIPLDPIDMPTATPRPSLAFSYAEVALESLGIKFEAPQGWLMDNSIPNTIVLIDPNTYDNVQGTLTVSITSVSSDYKLANVKQTLSDELEEISRNYTEWKTYQADSRTLMGKDGYYNNYRGVMVDGNVVRGRVMVALLDNNRIITVDMAAPGWYNESYMTILGHFRDTLQGL
ncbi:MAG: hypothetical protein IJB69_00490 [Clostridia bacterium]|nr:hypothetical protein [Clostridia bacterium]